MTPNADDRKTKEKNQFDVSCIHRRIVTDGYDQTKLPDWGLENVKYIFMSIIIKVNKHQPIMNT